MRHTANALTPSEIAEALNISRPDLFVRFDNTGGDVMCIIATPETDPYGIEGSIYIGMAAGHLGWSDGVGEAYEEWDDLFASDEENHAWQADEPLEDGAVALARIALTLAVHAPQEV